MPTAVVAPERDDGEDAARPCGARHDEQEAHASMPPEASASLADQLWFPWRLIVANPLLTLAVYVVCNAVYMALWWVARTLMELLTLPGLLLLLVTAVVAAIRRVASLLAYPGQLRLVIREGEANFARLTKRRVAMFVDAGQELARALGSPNQRMRFLQAHQNFEFAMETLLRPLLKALELVDKEASSAAPNNKDAPPFGVNSQLMLSLVREVTALHKQELVAPFNELLGSANASDFEAKRQRHFSGAAAASSAASSGKKQAAAVPIATAATALDASDDSQQPILFRFAAQLQRLQNMLPLIGRPQSETRRNIMWLLKELMCRRRKSGQADTIATLDLMRADMTVRFHGEQIWIPSSDGFRIDAMLIPPPPTPASSATATAGRTSTAVNDTERRAVIICNPNGGLYEFHHLQMDWIQFYTSLGCHVLVYNYRGYGRNAGSPSPLDHNRDGLAIVNFLKTQRGMAKIAVHGESIGGLVATYVASKSKDVDVMIADRTFSNVPALAQRMVASWAGAVVKWVMQWETDNCGNYLAATCAKLLCSDAGDEIIVDGASLKSGVALQLELGDKSFDLPRQLKAKDASSSGLPLPATSATIFPLWLASSPICRLLPGVSRNGARATRRVSEADSRPKLGRPLTEAAVARFSYAVLSIGQRAMNYTTRRDRRSDSGTSATVSSEGAPSADSSDVHVSISVDGANRSPSSSLAPVTPSDDEHGVSEDDHMLASETALDAGIAGSRLPGRSDAPSTSTTTPNFPEELLAVVWMQLARLDGYCGQCLLQAAETGGHDRLRAFTASLLRWGGCLSPAKRKQSSVEPFERRGIWIVPLVIEDVHATLQQLVEQYPAIKFDLDIEFLVCMVEFLMDTIQGRWLKRDEEMEQRRRQKREERALKKQQDAAAAPVPVALASRMRAAVGGKRHAIAGGSAVRIDDDEDQEDELPLLIQSLDTQVGTLLPLQCGHNKNYLEPEKDALTWFLRQVGFATSGR